MKTIGIVGGMGPEAGMLLFNSILTHTKATTDQEHLPVLLLSCPADITDRTAFLEGQVSVNPAFGVVKLIRKLELAGAEVIGLACNTIHAPEIFEIIRAGCLVQLLNMPLETCHHLRKNYPGIRKVGLMATVGTYKTGLYKNTLQQMGYEVIIPPADFQRNVIHRMIYDPGFGLKANANTITPQAIARMDAAIKFFEEEKAEVIILGCTELPLVAAKCNFNLPLISSTDALALALIREATQVTTPTNEQAATLSF